jgi:hypothetical protein
MHLSEWRTRVKQLLRSLYYAPLSIPLKSAAYDNPQLFLPMVRLAVFLKLWRETAHELAIATVFGYLLDVAEI